MQQAVSRSQKKRINTQRRHSRIREKFNEFYNLRIEGMRPDYDDVLQKTADYFFISERTVKNILKAG